MKITSKTLKHIGEGICTSALFITGKLVNDYTGPLYNFLNSYAVDITAPFSYYFLGKLLDSILVDYAKKRGEEFYETFKYARKWNLVTYIKDKGNLAYASLIFLGCAAVEIGQGLFKSSRGTYDPVDFIAYAGGVGLALLVDTLVSKIGERGTLDTIVSDTPTAFLSKTEKPYTD